VRSNCRGSPHVLHDKSTASTAHSSPLVQQALLHQAAPEHSAAPSSTPPVVPSAIPSRPAAAERQATSRLRKSAPLRDAIPSPSAMQLFPSTSPSPVLPPSKASTPAPAPAQVQAPVPKQPTQSITSLEFPTPSLSPLPRRVRELRSAQRSADKVVMSPNIFHSHITILQVFSLACKTDFPLTPSSCTCPLLRRRRRPPCGTLPPRFPKVRNTFAILSSSWPPSFLLLTKFSFIATPDFGDVSAVSMADANDSGLGGPASIPPRELRSRSARRGAGAGAGPIEDDHARYVSPAPSEDAMDTSSPVEADAGDADDAFDVFGFDEAPETRPRRRSSRGAARGECGWRGGAGLWGN
jgi:hypothetical protein